MLPDLLGLAIAATVVALPFLFRRNSRVAAGAPAVSSPSARRPTGGGAARREVQPAAEREPFSADNGVSIGEAS